VAVSGGPDSVCLLHALDSLTAEIPFRLRVAHLHHGQRKEGDADAEFVRAFAERLGHPCAIERADVPGIARSERISLEMAGRLARYRFFARLAEAVGAKAVATGHNADDQAETVLMRAFRGAGNSGLRGIPALAPLPESAGSVPVIRPLLEVSRAEIEGYLTRHGLETRFDATNLDATLQRNRVRRELLPLAEEISPGAKKGLMRIAKEAAEDEAALGLWAAKAWTRCARETGEGTLLVRTDRLPEPAAIRRRILRISIEKLAPDAAGFPEAAIDRLLNLLESEADGTAGFSLPLGIQAVFRQRVLRLSASPPPAPPLVVPKRAIRCPGETRLPELRRTLIAKETDPTSAQPFPPRRAMEAAVDADALAPPLSARTWEAGDRIRVLGTGGTKKLKELFNEAKIGLEERRRIPIICDAERIVWVPGLALNEAVKVTPASRRVLLFRLLEESREGESEIE
jgi:tRNA(Ile)-lysidine synthase